MSPLVEADNRVVAGGEDGHFYVTTGLPVGLHYKYIIGPWGSLLSAENIKSILITCGATQAGGMLMR
jgi:hypothetical protein